MTTCVVFGGAGFIGRHLLRHLAGTGRDVVCVDVPAARPAGLPQGCSFAPADEAEAGYAGVLRRADEIVDLAYASVPKTSFDDPIADITENLPRAVRLYRAALAAGVKRMVVLSSGGAVYGQPQELPITEDHPTDPISPYGITKLAVEKYALMFHASDGLPVICLRPGNAYGEGQPPFRGQGFVATAVASVLTGRTVEVYGRTGSIRDYVHVSDICAAVTAALTAGRPGAIYNVGTGVGTSNVAILDLLGGLAAAEDLQIDVVNHPPRPFDVSASILDPGRLQRETGWRPTVPLELGLPAAWEWYATHRTEWSGGPEAR